MATRLMYTNLVYIKSIVLLLAIISLLATSASAARRVHGIGEAPQQDATPLLLHHQVLFEKELETAISSSGESLQQFPTWGLDSLLEWDSDVDTRYISPKMQTLLQEVSDEIFPNPDPNAFVRVLNSPGYVYHRLSEAGITTLPVPIFNFPTIKLLLPYDLWLRYGNKRQRADVEAGMPATWLVRWRRY